MRARIGTNVVMNAVAAASIAVFGLACSAYSGCYRPSGLMTEEECGRPIPSSMGSGGNARGATVEEFIRSRGIEPSDVLGPPDR